MKEQRKETTDAVQAVLRVWNGAPLGHRAMVGAYVRPLVEALDAIDRELASQAAKREKFLEMMRAYLPKVEAMGVPKEILAPFEEILK